MSIYLSTISLLVLFACSSVVNVVVLWSIFSPDEEMETTEPSAEDRGKFERLLKDYVEATDMMSVESMELWHTRIRQCILQHKKDNSRLPLLEVGTGPQEIIFTTPQELSLE